MASSDPDPKMSEGKVVRAKITRKMAPEPIPDDELKPEDYMKKNYPDAVKDLKKWKKKYNWEPTFDTNSISHLMSNLTLHDATKGRNSKFNPGKQTMRARLWADESRRRKHKKTQEKGQIKVCAVAKTEDNDGTHCVISAQTGREPQALIQPDPQQEAPAPQAPLNPYNPFTHKTSEPMYRPVTTTSIYPQLPDPSRYTPADIPPNLPTKPPPPAYDLTPVRPTPVTPRSPVVTRATTSKLDPEQARGIYRSLTRVRRRLKTKFKDSQEQTSQNLLKIQDVQHNTCYAWPKNILKESQSSCLREIYI